MAKSYLSTRNNSLVSYRTDKADLEKAPAPKEELKMDGGYGWVIVLASFLLMFSTMGLNSAFGIYFSFYLENETFKGGDRIDYAIIGGISFGIGLSCAPFVNYIQGIIGTRGTIMVGNALQFASLMMASYAVSLWQLYLTQGLLQSFGLSLVCLPGLTLVSQWFVKKRVLANGLTVTGSGVGGVVFNLGMQKVIEVRSYQWALRSQAIIAAGLTTFAVILVRSRSKHHKIKFVLVDIECLKCTGFWLLSFFLVTCMFGYVIILFSLPNFTVSLGYTEYQGSIVTAMVQVGFCIGRPFAGFLSDYYGPATITVIAYYLASIFALAMWIPARNFATAIAFGILEGLLIGCVFSTIAAMIARLVGLAKLNVAICMLFVFLGLSATFSELIGSSMIPGNNQLRPSLYVHTSIFAGISFFVASTSMLLFRGYIIARDCIIEKEKSGNITANLLDITVPPVDIFRCCLTWPNKKA